MKRYLKTLRKDDAVRKVLEYITPIKDEELLPAYLCTGRITARAVHAKVSNPPFLCSAMDGFALSFDKTLDADINRPLTILKSETCYVNTGDFLPRDANAVIMVEDIEESETTITIRKPAHLWENVRMIGEDVIEGDMILASNQVISSYDMGMLISAGVPYVHVRRRPKMLIVPTGKELIDLYEQEEERDRQGLIDFNSYTLKKLAEDIGFVVEKSTIINDKNELKDKVNTELENNDVIIINAGTSSGTEDFTKEIVEELGEVVFHGVSMMPGKPTLFGVVRGKPVFGIPGYPVSAVLSFKAFIEPLYERMTGITRTDEIVKSITPFKIPSRIGIEEIVRLSLIEKNGIYYAMPLPRGASVFSSLAQADALLTIPEDTEGYRENTELTCTLLKKRETLKNRINLIGSHDLVLDIIRDMIRSRHPQIDFIYAHAGSLSGIIAFKNRIVDLCTTHIIDENEKVYNVPVIKRYLKDEPCVLINIAKRQQGLIVQRGNPKKIKGLEDISRGGIRFINRQYGSGTRILLDMMLKNKGIKKEDINGYDREESTHTAIGIMVRESIADAGVAVYSIAKVFSLDFIPLAEEDFDLLVSKDFYETELCRMLIDIINSAEFKDRLKDMGGYNTDYTGIVKYRT